MKFSYFFMYIEILLAQPNLDLPELWRLVYVLALFNTAFQEHRHFGSLCWSIQYGFNNSDIFVSYSFYAAQIGDT